MRLLFGLDSAGDPDWDPAVARDATAFEDILERLAEFFDEGDRSCTSGQRRVRYTDQERSVLGMYRDKIRWIREWCAARMRPGAARLPHGGQAQPLYRAEAAEGVGSGGGESAGDAMEAEYTGSQPQEDVLDQGIWEALFDWSWSGNGGMEVQAGV